MKKPIHIRASPEVPVLNGSINHACNPYNGLTSKVKAYSSRGSEWTRQTFYQAHKWKDKEKGESTTKELEQIIGKLTHFGVVFPFVNHSEPTMIA